MVEKRIDLYCKKCRKSMWVSYIPCGDVNAPVLSGVTMRCHTHKCIRVLTFKNVTEGDVLDKADKDGKLFV